jgi:hypothetical protein
MPLAILTLLQLRTLAAKDFAVRIFRRTAGEVVCSGGGLGAAFSGALPLGRAATGVWHHRLWWLCLAWAWPASRLRLVFGLHCGAVHVWFFRFARRCGAFFRLVFLG